MPRHTISTMIGKLVKQVARLRGSGSALPGLVVERMDRGYLRRTLEPLPGGVVLVSGTNGKTTTTKVVTELLQAVGYKVFTNRTGSNFSRGVISELLPLVTWRGKLDADIAVLELDEAWAVHFVRQVKPRMSLFLNVMRDQLDRFGEIDTAAEMLAKNAEAATEAKVWVMAPMISTAEEAEAFTQKARSYGLKTAGMMIEVPSAALMADKLFEHADFASVGTNDLTQYVMAADRLLSSLADLSTAWQPAVLRLIGTACEGASPKGRPVGVCGEAAADPALAAVLVGLGVASLSMTARALPDVDAVLKSVTLTECQELARIALDAATAEDARSAVRAKLPILEELGL